MMEWLKELLKNAGIEESKIDSIVGEVNKELPKHFVAKNQYNDLSESKKKLEADLAERDNQLETLSKTAGASEELKQKIEQLQADNKAAKEKYEVDAKNLRTETALKLKLAGKVHENALSNVIAEFDKDKIELDDNGEIKSGFDEQFKSLQESKGFYFVPEKEDKLAFKGFKPFEGSPPGDGDNGRNIGKMLAQQSKQAGVDSAKAQANYFGGMSNE